MVLGVFLYFALVTTVLALVFLPTVRGRAARQTRRALAEGRAAASSAASKSRSRLGRLSPALRQQAAQAAERLRPYRRRALSSVLVLAGMPLLPIALRGLQELDGFDHTRSRDANAQITALLQGEELVPPEPLPPELFTAREVEQARPSIAQASRRWELLDEDFRQRLLLAFRIMRERHGYEMVLLEGYRSPERQTLLAAMGTQVTQAGAFESYHQFGLAADCAFFANGRIVISEADAWAAIGYEAFGEVARSVGLSWGGRWRKLKDLGHVELPRPGVLGRAAGNAGPALPNAR